jgi:sugar phosphate isomerase/epimerase
MIGITSISFRELNVSEIIDFAVKAKIDGIEWGSDIHVLPGDLEGAKSVKRECDEKGIKIFSYGSYYCLGRNQYFEDYIETCLALGCKRIRIWAGKKYPHEMNEAERQTLVDECVEISKKALKNDIEICFEYHRNSLTATKESAYQLIQEVNHTNVFLYWQPNPDVDENEKLKEIDLLRPYIKTVHFFNWTRGNVRHLMKDGLDYWKKYIEEIDNKDIPYLLEFTKDDDLNNALDDIESMKSLLI